MNYEIVTMPERDALGISARTGSSDPDMSSVIGGLWNRFFADGIYESIPDKADAKALGIYTDYSKDNEYTVIVGCVTSGKLRNTALEVCKIPAGKYAKFVVRGNVRTAVAEAWQKIGEMNLPRNYICDYEEYQDSDMDNAEIHIYIGVNE